MTGDHSSSSSSPLLRNSVTAAAPSSTANLGPGFDIFGLAVDAFDDYVTIKRLSNMYEHHSSIKSHEHKVIEDDYSSSSFVAQLRIEVEGRYHESIPQEASKNSAGLALLKIIKDLDIKESFSVVVKKNVPPGFGLGSSAASAAAAVTAFDSLLDLHLSKHDLVRFAAEGERASAGSLHYDNVAASILGGFVLVRTFSTPPEFISIEPPENLHLVFAIPILDVPAKKTEVARNVLPKNIPLSQVVHNLSNASAVVAGFILKDINLLAGGMEDEIVVPARKHLIPCFDEVRANALQAGAIAVTISGAGPSILSIVSRDDRVDAVADAMRTGFTKCGVNCNSVKCSPSQGARVVSSE
jgi:homoserine kinase